MRDLLTTCWRFSAKCKLKMSEELLQVQETAFGDKKYGYCRLKLMVQMTRQAEHRGFLFQSAKSPRGQTCNGSSEQMESKRKRQRQCQNNSERGTAAVGSQKANVHLEKHARSNMTRTRKAKGTGRPRSPSPTGSPLRNLKGDGKGNYDGSAGGTKLSGKSPSGKTNRLNCTNIKKGSRQRRN